MGKLGGILIAVGVMLFMLGFAPIAFVVGGVGVMFALMGFSSGEGKEAAEGFKSGCGCGIAVLVAVVVALLILFRK